MAYLRDQRIGFVGAGVVGTALAVSLRKAGYQVVAVASRTETSAAKLARLAEGCQAMSDPQAVADGSDLVFITTPDYAIQSVASAIAWRKGQTALHCSGAESLDALEAAGARGAALGSLHPLQSFGSMSQGLEALPGTFFGIEASEERLAQGLAQMAKDLGGEPVYIPPESKALYHVAGVTTSGFVTTIVKLATDLWASFGISREEALRALLPLLKGTVRSLEVNGLPGALTGPVVRGDVKTIEKHLLALESQAPDFLPLYCYLGFRQLPLALSRGGLGRLEAEEIARLLNSYYPVRSPAKAGPAGQRRGSGPDRVIGEGG
ncbi:MAG: DUF2520 domain-containing protein [Chloroflexi bacterium]|nr:DUF2520 domain-containing protein [Chloroflexota bacterium]